MSKKFFTAGIVLVFALLTAEAAPPAVTPEVNKGWSIGISAISPGLPIAVKAVYQNGDWALQLEGNYFYLWSVLRADGRRTLRKLARADLYTFAGLTALYFDKDDSVDRPEQYTLAADFGIGAQLFIGKKKRFSIGAEGGLLIPFLSNISLDYYDNTGIIVANVYLLWRF
jgi:hypothetical protein